MREKDYKRIAAVIRDCRKYYDMPGRYSHDAIEAINILVVSLSVEFKLQNSRFDEDMFEAACKPSNKSD